MLSFLSTPRVYLAASQTDLRKSFDPLAGVLRSSRQLDLLSGHLFVFSHQRRNRVKILFWDKSGWWLYAQLLEAGTLAWPSSQMNKYTGDSLEAGRHRRAAGIRAIELDQFVQTQRNPIRFHTAKNFCLTP
jgi:transposase